MPEPQGTGFEIPWWAPLAAGGAAGLGTYGLSRIPWKVSAKKNPILRKIQDASHGKMYLAPYDETDLSTLTPSQRFMRSLTHGDEINITNPEHLKKLKKDKGAYWDWNWEKENVVPGVVNPHLGPSTRKDALYKQLELLENIDNKAFEASLLQKHAPEAMPRTLSISDLKTQYNLPELHEGLSPKELKKVLKQYDAAIRKEFKDFIIKPAQGGAASSGIFPTEKTNLSKEYALWSKKLKQQFEKEIADPTNFNATMEKYRTMEGFRGQAIDEMLRNNAIIQERLPLVKWQGRTAEKMRAAGQAPTKEYRIHVVGGQVIPELATPRYFSKDPRFLLELIKAREAAKWAQKNVIDKLPKNARKLSYGLDIAPIEGGGFKVIETNPGAGSGLLDPSKNPLAPSILHRVITGRDTRPMAAIKGLGAGLGTMGLGYGARGLGMLRNQQQIPQAAQAAQALPAALEQKERAPQALS